MFEESECLLSRFVGTYLTVFDQKKFPVKNLYKFRHDNTVNLGLYLNSDPD